MLSIHTDLRPACTCRGRQAAVACFLVGANEGSYFGAGNGWNGYDHDNVMTTWLKVSKECSRA
jgi:hypothetical protein